uniref:Uncharacterized protein n=1 Tax=Ciona intestinalis TaxID=7719 RepID=H2XV93_CIOIN
MRFKQDCNNFNYVLIRINLIVVGDLFKNPDLVYSKEYVEQKQCRVFCKFSLLIINTVILT